MGGFGCARRALAANDQGGGVGTHGWRGASESETLEVALVALSRVQDFHGTMTATKGIIEA